MCKVSMVPDRTVHSLFHTSHSNLPVIFCCLLLLAQFLTEVVHTLLHTAHSNILVIFCCLLLLIQVFYVQRTWFLTGLYIHCFILLTVIYWSYFVVCYY